MPRKRTPLDEARKRIEALLETTPPSIAINHGWYVNEIKKVKQLLDDHAAIASYPGPI